MQKQFIPAALALILALSAGSSYAPANPPDNEGCPSFLQTGFEPKPASFAPWANHNGDLWVCSKEMMTPQGRMITIVIDNNLPH